MKRNCYIYHLLVDGVVRYVGKGTGDRMGDHVKVVRSIARRRAAGEHVKATLLYNKLTARWLEGCEIETVAVQESLTDAEAFAAEVIEIASYPVGQLWNTHPGGQGLTSDLTKAMWSDPVLGALMRQKHREATASEGFSKAQSKASRAKWDDPAYRDRAVAAMREAASKSVEKDRKADAMSEVWAKGGQEERKSKISAAARRRYADSFPYQALAIIKDNPGIKRPDLVVALGMRAARQLHRPLCFLKQRGLIEKRDGGYYRTNVAVFAA